MKCLNCGEKIKKEVSVYEKNGFCKQQCFLDSELYKEMSIFCDSLTNWQCDKLEKIYSKVLAWPLLKIVFDQ